MTCKYCNNWIDRKCHLQPTAIEKEEDDYCSWFSMRFRYGRTVWNPILDLERARDHWYEKAEKEDEKRRKAEARLKKRNEELMKCSEAKKDAEKKLKALMDKIV